jgi:hypothetical protein
MPENSKSTNRSMVSSSDNFGKHLLEAAMYTPLAPFRE